MNIDEFESWVSDCALVYSTDFSSMDELLQYLEKNKLYDSLKFIKNKIKDILNTVESQEDQDFLTLKYSKYIN